MQSTYDVDKRKLLPALSHGSIFFSSLVISVGIPIAILLVSDDAVVKENAREAINFHFNVWLWGGIAAIAAALWWTIILLPFAFLGGVVVIFSLVMPILAILHCLTQPDLSYRYPLIFRLF